MNAFKDYCNSALELEMFDQFIERFNYMAIFGNPNVFYGKDWLKVIKTNILSLQTGGRYDTDSTQSFNECRFTGSMEVEILTSKMGSSKNLQPYIVGVEVRGITEKWVYDSDNTSQRFQHVLGISFRDVGLENFNSSSGSSMLSSFSKDLFYPMTLKR